MKEPLPIPRQVIESARSHVDGREHGPRSWDEKELNNARMTALEAIKIYKSRKKRLAEKEQELKELVEWLESIGEGVTKPV
jgi:hypothetical protein